VTPAKFFFALQDLLITSYRGFILIILFAICCDATWAQQKVSGKIIDAHGVPLAGVTVAIKGSVAATQSDANGDYSIPAKKGNILIFTFTGFEKKEIKIEKEFTINQTMSVLVNNLDEVVVTGYVSEKVKDITGSVAIVKPKELTAIPAGQVEPMLQGRVAGMNVITQGTPGFDALISIHGYGNFGDVAPLFIIDGIPGYIQDLNPDDIQSLQVLKDAGAAAIYGVRGANGVIVVTTKKGRQGNASVNFVCYFGYQLPLSKGYDLLNPQEMADATWQAYRNSNQSLSNPQYGNGPVPVLPDYILAGTQGGLFEGDPATDTSLYNNNPAAGPIYQIVKANKAGTDWLHTFFKPAFSQNYTVTASGGGNKSNYLFSAGYLNQQGTLINSYLKRYTVRINTEFNVLNNFRMGENLQISTREQPTYDGTGGNPGPPWAAGGAYVSQPIFPVSDIKGHQYGAVPGLGFPPNVQAYENVTRTKRIYWTILGNAFAELDFAKYFTLKTNFGGTLNNNYVSAYIPKVAVNGINSPSVLFESSGYDRNWSWQNTLTFYKLFHQNHSLRVLLGTEYISTYGRSLFGSRVNFYSDDPIYSYLANGGSGPGQISNWSGAYNSAIYSLFSRIDYAFNDKYLFTATLRRDGSSVFGPENRYGWFPSVSAAWRISKENFASALTWLTDLKLRGSWGKLGFDRNTPLTNQYSLYGGDPGSSFYDINGSNNVAVQGFRATSLGNAKTGWQTDIQTNIGLDATLWNNKLSLSADWYIKKSTGLLFPLALTYLLGGATAPYVNVGDLENTGFDLLLGSKGNITRDLRYDIIATFSTYENRIEKLNEGQRYFGDGVTRNEVGHPISSFYGYKIIGFFRSSADVAKSPVQDNAATGRFKYLDANNDGKITDSDRVFFGNPNPKFTLGLNIGLSFKNFDFSTFFYWVYGNDLFNAVKYGTDFFPGTSAKSKTLLYDSWSPGHQNAKVSINENEATFSTAAAPNSYGLEDGSYLRNKSMILGYSLSKNTLEKIRMKQFRIYVQVTNLFTISKYTGLDPETIGNPSALGGDGGNYPNNQIQWLIGLNVGF
jgi:TonB-linked SusC/RagA family outer membrane protein